jgi:hypothetical protein
LWQIFGPHNKQNERQRKAKNKLIVKRGTMYREIKLHKMAMKEITPQMKGMEYFCMSHTPFGMESIPVWGLFFAFPGI